MRLDVPWISQLGPDASYGVGDCGPACLAMILAYYGRQVTVDELSRQLGRPAGFDAVHVVELMKLADKYGLQNWWKHDLTFDDLGRELEAGRPAIVLLNYKALPAHMRYSATYDQGHFVVVTGLDERFVYYNDPFWPEPGKMWLERGLFDAAWGANHELGLSDRQAIMLARRGPDWRKVVWALEHSARLLKAEGLVTEHDYLVREVLPGLIAKRDGRG